RVDWLLYALLETWGVNSTFGPLDFNPFGAGVAALEQSGNDTVLRLTTPGSPGIIVRFQNTSVGDFTDYNLGTDISARPPVPDPDTETGTEGADTLTGTAGRDVFSGLGGNDSLWGAAGNDWLKGGDGNDTIAGGDGDDCIDGGNGRDSIDAGDGNDTINDAN